MFPLQPPPKNLELTGFETRKAEIARWFFELWRRVRKAYSTTATSITPDIDMDIVKVTGGTFTLPTAVDIPGKIYSIDNATSGNITVVAQAGETINGAATQTVPTNLCLSVYSDGANWRILVHAHIALSASLLNFTVAPASPVPIGTTLTLTNTSTNKPTVSTWSWKEDGVQFATTENTTRAMAVAGTYVIRLDAVLIDGTSAAPHDESVLVFAPVTDFTVSPASPVVEGRTITLTNTTLYKTWYATWSWKLDGVEFATTENATLVIPTAGTYTISLDGVLIDASVATAHSEAMVVFVVPVLTFTVT